VGLGRDTSMMIRAFSAQNGFLGNETPCVALGWYEETLLRPKRAGEDSVLRVVRRACVIEQVMQENAGGGLGTNMCVRNSHPLLVPSLRVLTTGWGRRPTNELGRGGQMVFISRGLHAAYRCRDGHPQAVSLG